MEILSLLEKVESLVNSSRRFPFTRKLWVDEKDLLDLVDQLKVAVPEDMKEAQALIQRRDNLMNQALMESRKIITAAEEEAKGKVAESQISQTAQKRAEELVTEAQHQAERLRREVEVQSRRRLVEANQYALEVLQKLEEQLNNFVGTVRRGIEILAKEGAPQEEAKPKGA